MIFVISAALNTIRNSVHSMLGRSVAAERLARIWYGLAVRSVRKYTV